MTLSEFQIDVTEYTAPQKSPGPFPHSNIILFFFLPGAEAGTQGLALATELNPQPYHYFLYLNYEANSLLL